MCGFAGFSISPEFSGDSKAVIKAMADRIDSEVNKKMKG